MSVKAFHISYEDTSGQHHVESYEAQDLIKAKALLKHPIKRYLGIMSSNSLMRKKTLITGPKTLNNNSIQRFSNKELSKKPNYSSYKLKDLLS